MRVSSASAGGAAKAQRGGPTAAVALVVALAAAALLAACAGVTPATGAMAVARLESRNGSTVRGTVSFTQRGDRVSINGTFFELWPGPHSIHIHAVGNCRSPNAASAGPVWNIAEGASGGKRTGDLPQLNATTEGYARLMATSSALSVGTGRADDVVGHSVVVQADLDPDPKAAFGVRNGWLACGVIERSEGLDLKDLL